MKITEKTVLLLFLLIIITGYTSAIDINSSTSLNYYNDDVLDFQIDTNGQINSQSNLNMNSNSITNFFGGQCSSGDVVVHVNDDGSFDCVDATGEVSGDFVDRSGDSMTGSLDMQSNTIVDAGSGNIDIGDGSGDIDMNGNKIYNGDVAHFEDAGITTSLTDAENQLSGLSSNSLYVAGDIEAGGDFIGSGGDLAENIRTEEETLAPGTVTTISGEMEVRASDEAYDRGVAGVVSTDPGVTLAKERDGVPLALSGIVPVNATVENGEIEPGDMITTSGEEGTAMKCQNVYRCQGAIIGKAMEPLNQDGKVEIIVTLG